MAAAGALHVVSCLMSRWAADAVPSLHRQYQCRHRSVAEMRSWRDASWLYRRYLTKSADGCR